MPTARRGHVQDGEYTWPLRAVAMAPSDPISSVLDPRRSPLSARTANHASMSSVIVADPQVVGTGIAGN